MRIVLDTNVLVSGIFFTGPPASILAAWAGGRFELIASVEVLAGYRRVICTRAFCMRWMWKAAPWASF